MMEEENMPLVTVVVPCYNHEKYVKETIESIVNQTYKNIELIVIDDGSEDNSVNVIQELSDKYNFTFIYRSNKGLSATLNEAIKLSRGIYFCACASDDIYMLDKIEKQVEFMEKNSKYMMCYGKIIKFNDFGKEEKIEIINAKSGFIFEDLIIANFSIPAVTAMIKKEVFENIGYYDESSFIEDWDMWLRIANKYPIGYLNEYLAYYRDHDTNIHKQTLKMYNSQKYILSKWHSKDNFSEYLIHWKLIWFNKLSIDFKNIAKEYLRVSLMNFYRIIAVKGLVKYFFIYKTRIK